MLIIGDTSVLSQKVAKRFYSSRIECVDWGNLIWLNEVPPDKTFVLWNLLYGHLHIDLEVIKKEWFYVLCVLYEVIMLNLFFICSFIILVIYRYENGWRKFFNICIWLFSLWSFVIDLCLKWLKLLSLLQLFRLFEGWEIIIEFRIQ